MNTITPTLRSVVLRYSLVIGIAPFLFLLAFSSVHAQKWDEFRHLDYFHGFSALRPPDSVPRSTSLWVRTSGVSLLRGTAPLFNPFTGYVDPDLTNSWVLRFGPFALANPSVLIGVGVPMFALLALSASTVGVAVAMLTLAMLAYFVERVPLRNMGLRSTVRLFTCALGEVWLWALALAAMTGLVVWYVGFDRLGATRALSDGFLPTRLQAMLSIVTWGIGYGLLGRVMLVPALAEYVGVDDAGSPRKCLRCLYPVDSIPSARCPECGTLIPGSEGGPPPLQTSDTRSSHRAIGRAVLVLAALVGTTAIVAAMLPQTRPWLLLRPRMSWIYRVHSFDIRRGSPLYDLYRLDTAVGQWWFAFWQVGIVRDELTHTPIARKMVLASVSRRAGDTLPLRRADVVLRQYENPPGAKRVQNEVIRGDLHKWYPALRVKISLNVPMLHTSSSDIGAEPMTSIDRTAINLLLEAVDEATDD